MLDREEEEMEESPSTIRNQAETVTRTISMKTLKGPPGFLTRSGVGKHSCSTPDRVPTGVRWTHSVRLAAYPAGLITLRSVVQIDPPLPLLLALLLF